MRLEKTASLDPIDRARKPKVSLARVVVPAHDRVIGRRASPEGGTRGWLSKSVETTSDESDERDKFRLRSAVKHVFESDRLEGQSSDRR